MNMKASKKYFSYGMLAAVAVWGANNVSAADYSGQAPTASANHSSATQTGKKADRKELSFIKEAAQGAQAEIEMGQLAAQHAQNADLKKFGQKLQQDHSKSSQDLRQIAQTMGVALPSDTARKEDRMIEKLQAKTGAEFDKAFAEHALKDHEKDITKYQKALNDVQDPQLKAFIQKSLPVLKEHLQMARNVGASVGVDAKTLASADRFLQGINRSEGLGTAPSSQSGQGQLNDKSSTSDHPEHK